MITAPKLDSLIEVLKNKSLNTEKYDSRVIMKVQELFKLLEQISPVSDSGEDIKILYFTAEKGTIENYRDYEDAKAFGEVSTYEEFENMFNEEYPEDTYWYKIVTNKYKNYYSVFINTENIIYANIDEETCQFENQQLQELIDFLIQKVQESINKLKDNTYNEYINTNLPYKNRFGVIKRSDYWHLYPETKNQLLEELSHEDIEYFIKNANDNPKERIKEMTSGKYFESVRLAYQSNNYDLGDLSDKELYLKYADGRDGGLSQIDLTSSSEFNDWFNNRDNFGSHPYEIIRGHSFSRVNLYIGHDDKGYYLSLDGTKILRKIEIVKIYIALTKNNIPVKIYNADTVKESLKGNDYLGIVPNEITPIYCEGYFKKYKPVEFIHLQDDRMLKYIKWEDLKKISLIYNIKK